MENVYERFVSVIDDTVRKMAINFVTLTNTPVVSAIDREKLTSDFVELAVEIFRANSIELKTELNDDLNSRITNLVNGLHAELQTFRTTTRNIN